MNVKKKLVLFTILKNCNVSILHRLSLNKDNRELLSRNLYFCITLDINMMLSFSLQVFKLTGTSNDLLEI